jgi:anti-sigma B factor antagonist
MAANRVTFKLFAHEGRRVLAVAGELDLAWSNRFQLALIAATEAAQDGGELVVDLSAVTFFDSCALQALVRGSQAVLQARLAWSVLASDAVAHVLDTAGIPPTIIPAVRPGSMVGFGA